MQNVLLAIHVMVALFMVGLILIQRSEGGGLGMGRSEASLLSTRGSANLLTRATGILATLFFITSIGLAVIAGVNRSGGSIFDNKTTTQQPPANPAGGAPSAPQAPTAPTR